MEELIRNLSWIETEGAPRSHVLKSRGNVMGTVRPPFRHLKSESGRTDRRSKDGVFGDAMVSTVTPKRPSRSVIVCVQWSSGIVPVQRNQ